MTDDPIDLIGKIARKTLDHLQKNRVPPTPRNFRLWFEYFNGSMTDLVEELNRLIQSGEAFAEKRMEEVYQRYLERNLNREEEEKLRHEIDLADRVNKRAHELILRLVQELFASKDQYSQYGLSLDRFNQKIRSDEGIEGIRGFLSSLLDETVRIQQTNTKLSRELDQSSKELNEMKQQLDEAKKEAIHDKLTQLLNRRAFERQIRQEAERFFRYKNPFSLIILDVDDFKNINDTYGHQIGDRALVSIAQQLMASVRKSDSVYRFGGEEFSVILPNTQVDKARLVAEKIRQSVLETEFLVRQVDVEITLSGGISQIREGDTIEEFILRADKALYLAKREGKNQIKSQDDLAGADGNLFLC